MEIRTSWEQEGWEEGKREALQEIALKMLQQNLPIEQIAQLTDLPIEQIQQLRSQLPQ
ncbi:hypothetical protein ACQ4M3_38640 [Leptolyngbya sp. AN03gr2]|uniref:hypothetical protein n=1 Tax=unclassified Leptolyngbya TaxID=2650499 RepID=UPI003D31C64A